MSLPEPPVSRSTQHQPAIELSNVWKIFGDRADKALDDIRQNQLGKAEVLAKYNCVVGVADVSLDVNPGEIFCVMGLSGSGKSTLVRHINRLLEPTAGSILVNGEDVMAFNQTELRRYRNERIAMVFQNFALMPHRSVLDNIAMPLEIRGLNKNARLEIARHNLDMVELTGWGNKFAHELSGGMQQRVGLARALASDPDILLMDEPFSALDPLIRRQLQDEFMKLSEVMKKTTVFITHDLDEAVRIGDRIAIMRDGRVVQVGTPEQIVMSPADDYVSDFVAGISRLKVVKAHAVMSKLDASSPQIDDHAPAFRVDDNLSTLITAAIEHDGHLRVVNDDGQTVGTIDRRSLLKTVIEGTETS